MDKKTEKIHEKALKRFDLARDANEHNVRNWLDDMRFARLGEQWPENVRRQRELDGRPCLTINKLPAFIRQVTNDARQNSPSIKFHPVGDGATKEVAEILDGLARNIEYTSDADVAYDTALDHSVTGGFGYFRIITDYASEDVFDQDIKIERIDNPCTVYPDAFDFGADSSNWEYCFITDMIKIAEFEKRWPDAEQSDFNDDVRSNSPAWFEDETIRIAEYWVREDEQTTIYKMSTGEVLSEEDYKELEELLSVQGITVVESRPTTRKKVTQYIMNGCEILETKPWKGKFIPIVPVYGDEIILEGKRYFNSLIRFAKDPQRMFNYWRTAATELVALAPKAPFIGAKGQFNTDAAKWATANVQTHAYIEYDPVNGAAPPQRQPFAGVPAGALQEAASAGDDMKAIMGIYDASLGARSNETSGKAILARQREGDVSTFNYIDNLSRAIRHAGRILCDLIPKIYNTPRIIRVIHENGDNKNVPVNQPYSPDQQHEQNEQQEMMQAIVKMHDLTAGKYDVTCEAGPSFTTKREEAASQMLSFIQSFPQAATLIGDKLARNLDWPEADDIADRLKAMLPPQLQGQNPQVQQAQQQLQQMQAQLQQTQAQASQQVQQLQQQLQQEKEAKALEAEKLKIDAYNAETNRLKAVGTGMQPEQVQALVVQTLQQVLTSPDVMPQQAPPPQQPQAQQQAPQGAFLTPNGVNNANI